MKLYKLFRVLRSIKLLSPLALCRLFSSIHRHGVNLMALLRFSARTYGERVALADERERLTYSELYEEAAALSEELVAKYALGNGRRVGLLCRNHASLVKALFAVSAAGADLYPLNVEMSAGQLKGIVERRPFDLLIADHDLGPLLDRAAYAGHVLWSCHDAEPSVNRLARHRYGHWRGRRTSAGRLVLLTGGTTGQPKEALHRPSLFHYLNPFHDFLSRLNILQHQTAYIATPIYHGYGIAVLLLFCAAGKQVVLQQGFDARRACRLIREHQVEVATVVPLMLQRLLRTNAGDLQSLACIACGGAELSPRLVQETRDALGDVLYNLYGTSEAGLLTIADPQDLAGDPRTVGRRITGVRLCVVDERMREAATGQIGQLGLDPGWSRRHRADAWLVTGDMGWRDERGCYYVSGRIDSMIVSGGENVYPLDVEQVLLAHPQVEDAAVVGVCDEQFGQRLRAYVQLAEEAAATEAELLDWLRPRLARYQLPREIRFVAQLPYTPVGKRDRKRIAAMEE